MCIRDSYKKEELGTNPKAIAAQANYLRQILNHVNPYTKLALKDEPYICFVELINEPAQHPQDFGGSVSYINALVDAVRDTGCQKITFFNISQDFAMAQAIAASRADGCSFAWYPSGDVYKRQVFVVGAALLVHGARIPVALLRLALRAPVRPDPELRVAKPIGHLVLPQRFPGRLEFSSRDGLGLVAYPGAEVRHVTSREPRHRGRRA